MVLPTHFEVDGAKRSEMETKSQSLEKVRQYAEKIKGKEYDGASSSGSAAYEAQLENTLSDLANRVTQQEAALDQV